MKSKLNIRTATAFAVACSAWFSVLQAQITTNKAETADDKYEQMFKKALADRDKRVGMESALKGVELGAVIAARLIEAAPKAFTNLDLLASVARDLAQSTLADKTPLVASSNQTFTVKTPVWETTNAVEIIPDHEKKFPPCTLIRYVENARTNEFHAWGCPVTITTNATTRR